MDIDAMQKAVLDTVEQNFAELRQKLAEAPLNPRNFNMLEANMLNLGLQTARAAIKATIEAEDPTENVLLKDEVKMRKKKPARTPSSAPVDC